MDICSPKFSSSTGVALTCIQVVVRSVEEDKWRVMMLVRSPLVSFTNKRGRLCLTFFRAMHLYCSCLNIHLLITGQEALMILGEEKLSIWKKRDDILGEVMYARGRN